MVDVPTVVLAGRVVDDVLLALEPNSDVDPQPAASGTVTTRIAASLLGDIPGDGSRSGSPADASARSRWSKQRFQPPSWLRTASSSHRSLWVKLTVVTPSASSNSISISVRVLLSSQIQVNARRFGGSISV